MSSIDEASALEHVIDGLVAKFPSLDPTTVRAVVGEVHSTFDGPVRDYVPLLVHRVSADRLRAMGTAHAPSRPVPRRDLMSA